MMELDLDTGSARDPATQSTSNSHNLKLIQMEEGVKVQNMAVQTQSHTLLFFPYNLTLSFKYSVSKLQF